MSNGDVKGQHYVPRTYLKRFSVGRNSEFYIKRAFKKDFKDSIIDEINIAKICRQNHLYTLEGDTSEKRMIIEKFYSNEIEIHYERIYQLLVDPNKNSLSSEERELIIATVVTMLFRTPKLPNQLTKFMNDIIERSYKWCKQNNKEYYIDNKRKVVITGKSLEQVQKEEKERSRLGTILTQFDLALRCIQIRTSRDRIQVIKINGDLGFITSDNPVACVNPGTRIIAPFDPTNILKLPLDNNHLLCLYPGDYKETELMIFRDTNHMDFNRKIASNSHQLNNAERFLLGREDSIKDFQTIIKSTQ